MNTREAPMKIVIACDSFKGSASAIQVASALASGIREVWPAAEIACVPVADGGEIGTGVAHIHARGLEEIPRP